MRLITSSFAGTVEDQAGCVFQYGNTWNTPDRILQVVKRDSDVFMVLCTTAPKLCLGSLPH